MAKPPLALDQDYGLSCIVILGKKRRSCCMLYTEYTRRSYCKISVRMARKFLLGLVGSQGSTCMSRLQVFPTVKRDLAACGRLGACRNAYLGTPLCTE